MMISVNNEIGMLMAVSGGFTVGTKQVGQVFLIIVRAWGFWEDHVADKWLATMQEAFEKIDPSATRWAVVVDNREFMAQRPYTKGVIKRAMTIAKTRGMSKSAVVVGHTSFQLQLQNNAKEVHMANITFHWDEELAIKEALTQ